MSGRWLACLKQPFLRFSGKEIETKIRQARVSLPDSADGCVSQNQIRFESSTFMAWNAIPPMGRGGKPRRGLHCVPLAGRPGSQRGCRYRGRFGTILGRSFGRCSTAADRLRPRFSFANLRRRPSSSRASSAASTIRSLGLKWTMGRWPSSGRAVAEVGSSRPGACPSPSSFGRSREATSDRREPSLPMGHQGLVIGAWDPAGAGRRVRTQ